MDVKKTEYEYEGLDWIYLAKEKDKRWAVGKAVMNVRIS